MTEFDLNDIGAIDRKSSGTDAKIKLPVAQEFRVVTERDEFRLLWQSCVRTIRRNVRA